MTQLLAAARPSLSIAGRVAYVVNHSFPHSSNGYAVRSHGVAAALAANGHSVIVINRPGRPWDIASAKVARSDISFQQDGVQYLCLPKPSLHNYASQQQWAEAAADALEQAFRVYKPAVVIAASNWENAEPAMLAAKRLKLPFYYEVRGFWELSRASADPSWQGSDEYKHAVAKETAIACAADKVITLNPLMQQQLVKRGVAADKIIILPNGVNALPQPGTPAKPGTPLRVGYIGSFSAYEGLDDLLQALALLRQSGLAVSLNLVGSGNQSGIISSSDSRAAQQLQAKAEQLGIAQWVSINPRVANGQIAEYYQGVDLIVNPRRSYPVTELVSSLKPIEAAAYAKPVLLSDVAPNKLLADECSAFTLFSSGDVIDLAAKLKALLTNAALYQRCAEQGAKWVAQQRQFSQLIHVLTAAFISSDYGIKRDRILKLINQKNDISNFSASSGSFKDSTGLKKFTVRKIISSKLEESKNQEKEVLELKYKAPVSSSFDIDGKDSLPLHYCILVDKECSSKDLVLEVKFFDKSNNLVLVDENLYARSKAFDAYKYLEASNSSINRVLSLPVPKGAVRVDLLIHLFNSKVKAKLVGTLSIGKQSSLTSESLERRRYFEKLLSKAKEIPLSNGSRHFEKYDLTLGVIGDVYMFNFYKDVCKNVIYLSPDNLDAKFSSNVFDVIIYTTCWKGIDNEEWRGVKFREKPKKALEKILSLGKKQNAKLVFQSIEDPSNYDYFIDIARKFDFVITTDTDCIDKYKFDCGHENVFYGEYGFNPQLNNPIGCRRDIENAFFFAGSYPTRYKERCDDMQIILDSIINSGGEVLIADRNYDSPDESVSYPSKYSDFVVPPVEHSLLQRLHKVFRYNLNFNSIKTSPTMCAMRVYELQAQCNGFMSNYANSVYNNFPGIKIVPFVQDFSSYIQSDETWEEYRIKAHNAREVLNTKTSFDVFRVLMKNVGVFSSSDEQPYSIAVITEGNSESASSRMQSQTAKNLVWSNFVREHNVRYFSFINHDFSYECNYLQDLLNAFKYVDVDYITKGAYFLNGSYVDGPQYEFVNECYGLSRSMFSTKTLTPRQLSSHKENDKFTLANGYSIDPFELNYIDFRSATSVNRTHYALSVIIPVYNNSRFLLTKCLPSIFSNKRWEEFELILVDDGSTDGVTLDVLEDLKKTYSNIVVIRNDGNGSGSASRPRNQGIDRASAKLISFLDPDNEICLGGYDKLLDKFDNNQNVDFISGFHVKVSDSVKVIGRHTDKPSSVIKDPASGYFKRGKFPVVATQAAVISKEFLNSNNIRFVERSAGQDTLFGWEILAKSQQCSFVGDVFIVYYAERTDSITNAVDISYFEKKLILEQSQVKFLKNEGILEPFLSHHYDNFMKSWYLEKLKLVPNSSRKACEQLLGEIAKLYNKKLTID